MEVSLSRITFLEINRLIQEISGRTITLTFLTLLLLPGIKQKNGRPFVEVGQLAFLPLVNGLGYHLFCG